MSVIPIGAGSLWPLFQRLLSSMPDVRRKVDAAIMPLGTHHSAPWHPKRILAPASFDSAIRLADIEPIDMQVDWVIVDLDDGTVTVNAAMINWALRKTGGHLIAKASTPSARSQLNELTQDWSSKGLWRSQLKLEELSADPEDWEKESLQGWTIGNVWMMELRPAPWGDVVSAPDPRDADIMKLVSEIEKQAAAITAMKAIPWWRRLRGF